MVAVAAEADRLAQEAFAQDDANRTLLTELERQKKRLTRLEDLYLDANFDKERYLARKGEISPIIRQLEDKLYAATQVTNFTSILNRITATLPQLPDASPETKKTLINSVIKRLDVGSGEITHLVPRPWARPFF